MLTDAEVERFWAKVDKRGPDDCWPWLGAKSTCNKQYTPMTYGGFKQRRAHRWAWAIANGRMPLPEHVICHRCDNPLCVNPAHLFEGTRADNQKDMQRKLRSGIIGAKNPKAKLTETQVLEIRGSDERDVVLAERYGVHHTTIYMIKVGRKWRNLPGGAPKVIRRKLTTDQVSELRRRHQAGENCVVLGRSFGISQCFAWQVAKGHAYKTTG
jgi:hypothetical protein